MRTTLDLPDALFRETKAQAALRGSTMKDLIIRAIKREIAGGSEESRRSRKLPHIKSKSSRKLDLSKFDFDELILG